MLNRVTLVAVLMPAVASAASPFGGTWVLQPEQTNFRDVKMQLTVDRGKFQRTDCRDSAAVPIDGASHELPPQPFVQSIAVKILDSRRVWEQQWLKGKIIWTGTYTVAADGRAMSLNYEDARGSQPVTVELQYLRDGDKIPGAHILTGAWIPQKLVKVSPSGSILSMQDSDTATSLHFGDGTTYEAPFDIRYHPVTGYVDGAAMLVGHTRADELGINRMQNGQITEMARVHVSADGRSLTFLHVDRVCQGITTYTYLRQTQSVTP